ncbi:MAG: fasciclin domain-containing protein [Flavobacteriaceae bacterium]|nr:fasciclin domain-containing protein [Flavobacteriaceae bacterium]
MKSLKMLAVAVFATFVCTTGIAQNSKTVVENAIGSKDHTTLVAAIKAGDLVETLSGKGPFTVFAPTNQAFANLPKGTLESLLLPENKSKLQAILTYHVVAGNLDSKAVVAAIKAGNGEARVTTVQGGTLVAKLDGKNVILIDENGNKSTITAVDIYSSNGVIHVIDSVVLPK